MNYYVYIHISPNGKRYVGLTTQKLANRWNSGKGYRKQKLFMRAIEKNGWANIEHIVYEVNSQKEMKYLEAYLIRYYNTTDKRYGYNITPGGEHPTGYSLSEETKKKMSECRMGEKHPNYGRKWSDEVKRKMSLGQLGKKPTLEVKEKRRKHLIDVIGVSVQQFTKDGILLNEYNTITEASISTGIKHSNISGCCKGIRKTAGGYIWKRK